MALEGIADDMVSNPNSENLLKALLKTRLELQKMASKQSQVDARQDQLMSDAIDACRDVEKRANEQDDDIERLTNITDRLVKSSKRAKVDMDTTRPAPNNDPFQGSFLKT